MGPSPSAVSSTASNTPLSAANVAGSVRADGVHCPLGIRLSAVTPTVNKRPGEVGDFESQPRLALTDGRLQRIDERYELVFLSRAQGTIVVDHEVRLRVMPQYRVIPGQRLSVVHQTISRPHSPQGSRSHEIGGSLPAVLDDPIRRSDIMQEEISKRVNGLVAQRGRHCESSTVDHGPGCRGRDAGHVTDCAADGVEDVPARLGVSSRGKRVVPRGRLGRPHEAGEYVYIVVDILGIGSYLANGGEVSWAETIGDSLLVEVSIAGKREQACHLILP